MKKHKEEEESIKVNVNLRNKEAADTLLSKEEKEERRKNYKVTYLGTRKNLEAIENMKI